jgi:dimethylargininase
VKIAITRPVSPALDRCELSFVDRNPIDIGLAISQHRSYLNALIACGCAIRELAVESDLPDSVFVGDTAVVLDEVAVITRPGAESRRAEVQSMASMLGQYRELVRIAAPATLDGGDVLRIGRTLYVGESARSNAAAIEQLRNVLGRFGYRVQGVPLRGCLHLKTAVTLVAPGLLLANPEFVEAEVFDGMQSVAVDPSEPHAANALRVEEQVIYPQSCPRTAERLKARGLNIVTVDMSETEKAEGGVTCCSVIFEA